jgi:hypothetical protein
MTVVQAAAAPAVDDDGDDAVDDVLRLLPPLALLRWLPAVRR